MRNIATYNIKLETLTPLHIGDGNTLNSSELALYNDDGDRYIAIIDPEKVLSIIGQENIGRWVSAIDRGQSITEFMAQFAGNAKVTDYAKRSVFVSGSGFRETDSLKTFIHDGMGYPYLPGSSLKGSIRTAILSILANQMEPSELSKHIGGGRFLSASDLEKFFFGASVNQDIFRFLRVSDARFEEECEIALREINLNIREQGSLVDKSKAAWIEAVEDGRQAESRIQIDIQGVDAIRNTQIKELLGSAQQLVRALNNHTEHIIKEEIRFWLDQQETSSGTEDYIDNMKRVLGVLQKCGDNSCVLRVGHGSGWRFMTGSWAERLDDDDWDRVVDASRPGNRRNYSQYPFPKSRRIEESYSDPLGFVKLSLI